jgi:hypothetical protein
LGNEMQDVSEFFGFAVTGKAAEIGNTFSMTYKSQTTHMEAQFLQIQKNGLITQFPKEASFSESSIKVANTAIGTSDDTNSIFFETVGTHLPIEHARIMFPSELNR